MYYDSIPNSNKKVILIRRASGSDFSTMSDSQANWRSLFADIIKTSSNPSYSNMAGISPDSLENTHVNSNVSLLMTNQISDLGTNNKFNPIVSTLNNKLNSLGGERTSQDIANHNTISGIIGGIKDISNTALAIWDQIAGNYQDSSEGNFKSNRSIMPWFTNVETWEKYEANLSFKYTFNFNMGQYGLWNAREEVFLPIVNLIAPTLIRNISLTTTEGPYPTAISMVTKALDFDKNTIDNDSLEDLGPFDKAFAAMEQIITSAYDDFSYSISFGSFLKFNKVIIKNSSYSFSRETDQFGYPISGSVTLEFSSIVPISLSSRTPETMAIRLGIGK